MGWGGAPFVHSTIKIKAMNTNLTVLKAMLMLAETLTFSQTYKSGLIGEIKHMIEVEELLVDRLEQDRKNRG